MNKNESELGYRDLVKLKVQLLDLRLAVRLRIRIRQT